MFIFAIVALFISAKFAVKYGTLTSLDLALPAILIGIFIISLGTTLPELITGISAVMSKHQEISLGNIVGSVVTNSTLVLGVASVIHPIKADFILFLSSAIFLVVMAFLFATFVQSGRKIDWREGVAMILLYVFFLVVELNLKGIIG